MLTSGPIEVAAFEAANARAYLRAVFAAWDQGQCVMALPEGAGRKTVPGTKILGRESFAADPGWFEADLPAPTAEDRALIAFSSGTTGRPKAILLQHRALQDVVSRINTAMGIDGSIREYLGVPVTYSFGFGRARAVAAAGGAAFLPEHGFDPSEIGRMLAAGEINAVSAVPTLWRVLLANKDTIPAESARNLKWIEIGSQWMTGTEKLELRQLFPNAKIVQHYGLTEASRSTLLDVSEAAEDRLDSVGRAEGAVEISIDAEGRIRTRGPHVAEGLVSGAGVKPVTDDDGWLTTSDRGRIEDGWLFYEGRVDELINAGGLKIDPTAFEQAVNTVLGVPGAVAAGRLADDLRGEKVLVALRQDAGLDRDTVTGAIRAEAERIGLTGNGSFELREVAALPLTATGKVKRAELPALDDIGSQPSAKPAEPVKTGSKLEELQALWAELLGLEDVPTDKSFYDLGGDSLSALTAIMRMQSLGIDPDTARGIFEGKTIAEMAGEAAPAAAPAPAEAAPDPDPTPTSGKTAELQALWGEILGLEDVPTGKSFYDLGGDSLSALTAIMRMQSLGIDPDTARGIFEGKTIAEMAGDAAPAIPEPPPTETAQVPVPAPTSGKTAELQALWGEILGLEDVPTDKSFYDLGGDSLSALTTIMRMQSLGIDPDTARGIFEGKTIADLAGETAPAAAAPPPPAPPQPAAPVAAAPEPAPTLLASGLNLAKTVNAVHATRGVLVIWVVIVHWLPALLERLGDNATWIYGAFLPAWRFGTPGFAMVFGIGVGALGLYHYQSNRELFFKSSRLNTKLIVGGLLILVAARAMLMTVEGQWGDRLALSGLFYSVITYYALAMLTLPLLVRLLSVGPNRLLTIFGVAAASLLIHTVLFAAIGMTQPPALLEFFKLILTAKYGFFRMTFYVLIGVAIGYAFRRYHAQAGVIGQTAGYGLVLITLGGLGLYQAAPVSLRLSFNLPELWHLSIYAGVALLILAGFAWLNLTADRRGPGLRWFNTFFVASGILALPMFVGHAVLIVLKNLLDAFGVPDALGLALVLVPFFLGFGIAYRKLFRVLG
ncbi:MAG: AMP-binding protein [Rhodobacter sp.]|nr:AMP-binding protein [Rhodobacter sp.]